MCEKGIRFGKALQMTNILRDCGKDLRIGRCYLPDDVLGAHAGVADLMAPTRRRARAVLVDLLRVTLDQYRDACLRSRSRAASCGCGSRACGRS